MKNNMTTEKLKADVVVVGAGGSGLAAAVAAAEKGASVVVLEKYGSAGGNSKLAEGFFAAESPAQKRMLIDARKDDLFKIAMEYSHWTLDADIVRAFINKSGDTVSWLEDKGLYFDWIPAFYPNQVPLVWHCLKGRGIVIINLLLEQCEKLGARVFYKTAAKKIIVSKAGKVTGILAATEDKELRIVSDSVIIATGGYGGNRELLKKYFAHYSENIKCLGFPNMGDGLMMAQEAGAATEGLGILHLVGPDFVGSSRISATATEPNAVWVNKNGKRFTDEASAFNIFESANSLLRQPDMVCYSLIDDNTVQNVIKNGVIKGAGILIVPPRTLLPGLDDLLRKHARKGTVKIADSWDSIARWIGVESTTLETTIKEYNSFCESGCDEHYAKDRRYLTPLLTPPFYAIKCYPDFLDTIGGIKINRNMEVINTKDTPVRGLYAAGIDTGGWEDETYNAVLSGTTFGFALNSGRIAGENAADYSKST